MHSPLKIVSGCSCAALTQGPAGMQRSASGLHSDLMVFVQRRGKNMQERGQLQSALLPTLPPRIGQKIHTCNRLASTQLHE